MSKSILPPTETMLQVVSLIDDAIARFLKARRSLPPLGTFESEVEAVKLFNLVIRHIESITELAKIDLVLAPSANVLARAAFEIAARAAWMITPVRSSGDLRSFNDGRDVVSGDSGEVETTPYQR